MLKCSRGWGSSRIGRPRSAGGSDGLGPLSGISVVICEQNRPLGLGEELRRTILGGVEPSQSQATVDDIKFVTQRLHLSAETKLADLGCGGGCVGRYAGSVQTSKA